MPDDQFSSTVAADGTATIQFTPTKNKPWQLQQVSIEMENAPSGCTAEIRKNGNLITLMLPSDVADSDPPIPVAPGDRVQVNWFNSTEGLVGNVYIVYFEVEWS